ncbi:MAG: PGPGW domain-containing protein [Verrucomicrobiota bacterium]
MFKRLKRSLHPLREGDPGHRFRDRHERMRREGGPGLWTRLARFVVALVCIVVGVVLVFIPGPAVLFFFFAGGLLAAESRVIAGWMDKTELLARSAWRRLRRLWSG